jgi:hypothetical protein
MFKYSPGVDTLIKSGKRLGVGGQKNMKEREERKRAHHENSMSILQNRYFGIF